MWNIRLLDKPFNAKVAYDGHPTLFTIKLYHGGEFTKFPDVQYIDGSVNYVDMVDIDTFSVHELDAMMKGFRYGVPPVIYYHFLVPGGDFHFGLKPLGNDDDLRTFAQYVCDHKIMRVYTEHAIAQLFPVAEHGFCLRHIYENMRKRWRTTKYKEKLWNCAKATTVQEFNRLMKAFSEYDIEAYEWLKKIPPQHWARSHFTGRPITDMLLNNLCEVFNSKLIEGRDKPIITCLEYIREYMMKRICNVIKVQQKCASPLTPTATKIMESNTTNASNYIARWNSSDKYEVQGPWQDQHVVDMGQRVCSCRKWELTGIPCRHVIAVLFDKADNGEDVGELYTYVHKVHWLETWKEAYSYKVEPIKGRIMWPVSDCPIKISPPPHRNQPGRPKKKRQRSMDEKSQS
ncbi:unnamed protein product [Lactuca saligna]|uniref:SWIM-type domain-containing protein n=1 Tax=Lactuca saligna TaxID=75948 RepID=A0AA35VA30_LACSI|nr:unnamed protein product [Lactuca saligna]